MPDIFFIAAQEDGPPANRVLNIRMKVPPETYVSVKDYGTNRRSKFQTVCDVASRAWSDEDAGKAFFEGVSHPKVITGPNGIVLYLIDQPKAGIRKRLVSYQGWLMVETAIYREGTSK
jgi:hypothetical protein